MPRWPNGWPTEQKKRSVSGAALYKNRIASFLWRESLKLRQCVDFRYPRNTLGGLDMAPGGQLVGVIKRSRLYVYDARQHFGILIKQSRATNRAELSTPMF